MKTMNTLKVLSLMLLLAIWQPLSAQEALTTIRQSEENQEQISSPDNSSIKETYWMPSIVGRGIYYLGLVGINTTSPTHELHVVGSAYVSSLNINGQYNLPTTRATAGHYLNGLGEWTPMSIGGGTGFWQGLTGDKGIFYNGGLVGINIGADMPRYQLHVNGSVGVRSLEIIGEYSLPGKAGKEDEYLNGFGEWTPIEAGDSFWQGGTGTGIYFNRGAVGIGTTGANANASLQVVGNMNVGNNPHTGILIGENAFVGGQNSIASGNYSFAFGRESKATHMNAVAIGFKAEATSEMAVSIGYINKARAESTYLFGERLSAGSSGAFVIGRGASSENSLQNNVNSSLMIGFNSTVPTFFVGPSEGAGTTGNIGIGNLTDPQAKLHIYSDVDKAATLKLEHRTTGTKRYAEIGLGTHSIRAGNTENMVFSTPATNRHFVFENGNVGIGVANPSKKLVVAGDIDFSGNLYSNGQLFTGSNWTVNGENIYRSTGNVGIGTNNPQAALDVQGNSKFRGNLYVEEVIVEEAANWPDYVFEANYQLMDLNELKSFITINKHLPDMPKADENGKLMQVKLAEMNALLLKKIEELTLYILEQEERIREIENALK
jgi:hypothetical protein